MKRIVIWSLLTVCTGLVQAKIPAPALSDEAKAKAAEAAARTAHGNKVADYQLCRSMDRVAARYLADAKKAGKDTKAPAATPPCADPGAFAYSPAASTAAPAAAAPVAAPAPAKAPDKKG